MLVGPAFLEFKLVIETCKILFVYRSCLFEKGCLTPSEAMKVFKPNLRNLIHTFR